MNRRKALAIALACLFAAVCLWDVAKASPQRLPPPTGLSISDAGGTIFASMPAGDAFVYNIYVVNSLGSSVWECQIPGTGGSCNPTGISVIDSYMTVGFVATSATALGQESGPSREVVCQIANSTAVCH